MTAEKPGPVGSFLAGWNRSLRTPIQPKGWEPRPFFPRKNDDEEWVPDILDRSRNRPS